MILGKIASLDDDGLRIEKMLRKEEVNIDEEEAEETDLVVGISKKELAERVGQWKIVKHALAT